MTADLLTSDDIAAHASLQHPPRPRCAGADQRAPGHQPAASGPPITLDDIDGG